MAKKIEVGVLMSVFIFVAGCFSVPIIVYVNSFEDTSSEVALIEMLVEQFDINGCSQKVQLAIAIVVFVLLIYACG